MNATKQLATEIGIAPACRALGINRASYYRHVNPQTPGPRRPAMSHRALRPQEREMVLKTLNSDRFMDRTPRDVYATLLDEGRYLCSVSTMYRILNQHGQVRERRNQRTHPPHVRPELVATAPNQVWTWDITKLLGPRKWTYYSLYVILDLYSRYVVGWSVAERESAALAGRLIHETAMKQGVQPGQLGLHSDRGAPMTSQLVAQLLAHLGVTKTHSRPRTSNDNPYSESQFKTMKYRPEFPDRFGSLADAIAFCRTFFRWYNGQHRHTALGLLTPEQVHYGVDKEVIEARNEVLAAAYVAHPERFVNKPPRAAEPAREVWINRPAPKTVEVIH